MAINESRIEAAHRRVRIARYSIGAMTAVAFPLIGIAVRDAHPATHTGSTPVVSTGATAQQQQDDSFSFDGGGSISPSTSSAPTIQSSGS